MVQLLKQNTSMSAIRRIHRSNPKLFNGIRLSGNGRIKQVIIDEMNERIVNRRNPDSNQKSVTSSPSNSSVTSTTTPRSPPSEWQSIPNLLLCPIMTVLILTVLSIYIIYHQSYPPQKQNNDNPLIGEIAILNQTLYEQIELNQHLQRQLQDQLEQQCPDSYGLHQQLTLCEEKRIMSLQDAHRKWNESQSVYEERLNEMDHCKEGLEQRVKEYLEDNYVKKERMKLQLKIENKTREMYRMQGIFEQELVQRESEINEWKAKYEEYRECIDERKEEELKQLEKEEKERLSRLETDDVEDEDDQGVGREFNESNWWWKWWRVFLWGFIGLFMIFVVRRGDMAIERAQEYQRAKERLEITLTNERNKRFNRRLVANPYDRIIVH